MDRLAKDDLEGLWQKPILFRVLVLHFVYQAIFSSVHLTPSHYFICLYEALQQNQTKPHLILT